MNSFIAKLFLGYHLRGPYLARFQLCLKSMETKLNTGELVGDTTGLFMEYFRKFGHKPCCVSDLRCYLGILDTEKRSDLASRLMKDVGISDTSIPETVNSNRNVTEKFNNFSFRNNKCKGIYVHSNYLVSAVPSGICQRNISGLW